MYLKTFNNHVSELSENGFTVMQISDDISKELCQKFINEAKSERSKDDPLSMYPVHRGAILKSIINLKLKKLLLSIELKKFCNLNKFKNIANS